MKVHKFSIIFTIKWCTSIFIRASIPRVEAEVGHSVGEKGTNLESIAVMKTRGSLGVVENQPHCIIEDTRIHLKKEYNDGISLFNLHICYRLLFFACLAN